ncbi:MAG: hypothetical protein A2284_16530 [Deltaproteobacteria bacterium RIFOXYA12_FULL_61_11]|nr:MAG: hypothetical protein A2284_16530 [Deltaproteobacteria bacterium RIFOXYA12_FULL_61_11]
MQPVTTAAKVLIVDDERAIAELLARFLSSMALEVRIATDGREAQHLLEEDDYALLITDYSIPHLTGGELIAWIKDNDRPTRTILTTGYATLDKAIEVFRNGAHDFIMKPFNKQIIVNTVNNALQAAVLEREQRRARDEQRSKEVLALHGLRAHLKAELIELRHELDALGPHLEPSPEVQGLLERIHVRLDRAESLTTQRSSGQD